MIPLVNRIFAALGSLGLEDMRSHNMRRFESLMESHEANLRSGDPAKVAESKERWKTMCRSFQSNSRLAALGLDLERWGDDVAMRATVPN